MRDGQRQAKLSAPRFDLAQEDVHLSGIQIGCMSGLPRGGLFTSDKIGVSDFDRAQIGLLEVALYPIRGCVCATGFNQVFADFRVPHVAECILAEAAFFAPLFDLQTQAFSVREMLLKNLAYSVEIAAVKLDAALRDVHASPPERSNAECGKTPVAFAIGDRYCFKVLCAMRPHLAPEASRQLLRLTMELWLVEVRKSKLISRS